MEDQINISDQNTQQIGQNPVSQPVQILGKPKVNYWMILTIVFGFLFLIMTSMFFLGPKIKEKIAPIVSMPKLSVMPINTDDARVGDGESYIDFSSCDQSAQFVIDNKNFSRNLIHSCISSQKILDSEPVNVVDIFYGPPGDCPSGCIYKRFIGVLILDKSFIQEVPPSGPEGILGSVWAQPPLDTARNYPGFECSSQLEDYIDVTLGKEGNNYGWKLSFQKPLICSFEEFVEAQQTLIKRSLTLDGSMFVYLEEGEERWSGERLVVNVN